MSKKVIVQNSRTTKNSRPPEWGFIQFTQIGQETFIRIGLSTSYFVKIIGKLYREKSEKLNDVF